MTELELIQIQIDEMKAKAAAKKQAADNAIALKRAQEELKYFQLCEEKNLEPGRDCGAVFASNTGKCIVVSKPKALVFQVYNKATRNIMGALLAGATPKEDTDAEYNLVKSCLLYPTIQEVTAMREETPAIIAYASGMIQRLAGELIEDIEKK